MKHLLLIPSLFIIFSCTNDDDSIPIKPNPEPNKEEIYKFSNNYNILDLKYYKGTDGNEYAKEADTFFKKQWFFYNDPSIKIIHLKKDSIIINENLSIQKYKYTKDGNNILIEKDRKKIILGYVDQTNKSLNIYKNFQSSLIISNKETNEILYSKGINYGKITYNDMFPLFISSPKVLTSKDEFVFWCNIEYTFTK
ncbi:hypothetical protein [Empedobacter tilapiae]